MTTRLDGIIAKHVIGEALDALDTGYLLALQDMIRGDRDRWLNEYDQLSHRHCALLARVSELSLHLVRLAEAAGDTNGSLAKAFAAVAKDVEAAKRGY